jgi:hypothetical protein
MGTKIFQQSTRHLKILGATVQNVFVRVTWRPGFLHSRSPGCKDPNATQNYVIRTFPTPCSNGRKEWKREWPVLWATREDVQAVPLIRYKNYIRWYECQGEEENLDWNSCSLHDETNYNGTRLINYAVHQRRITEGTLFPHRHIHEGKWHGPVDKTVYQMDHVISYTIQTYLLSGVTQVLMLIRITI